MFATVRQSFNDIPNIVLTVADLHVGFSEGGFYYSIVCEAQAKIFATTPIFDRFGERLLALPVNRSIFDQDLC